MTDNTGKTATTTARRPPASPEYKSPQEILMGYVTYRKAQIQATLGPPGVNRGGAAAIQAQQAMSVLTEFEALAEWLSAGQPGANLVLTEGDKQFWRNARDRGLDVPKEIADRL